VNEAISRALAAYTDAVQVTDQALEAERQRVRVLISLMRAARKHGFDHRLKVAKREE
jgi:hypothetical protein